MDWDKVGFLEAIHRSTTFIHADCIFRLCPGHAGARRLGHDRRMIHPDFGPADYRRQKSGLENRKTRSRRI
jgi:hypothetical protein